VWRRQNPKIVTEERWNSEKRKWCPMIYGRGEMRLSPVRANKNCKKNRLFQNPLLIPGGKWNSERTGHLSGLLRMGSEKTSPFFKGSGRGVLPHKKVSILFLSLREWL
jgi:hypothetical protein